MTASPYQEDQTGSRKAVVGTGSQSADQGSKPRKDKHSVQGDRTGAAEKSRLSTEKDHDIMGPGGGQRTTTQTRRLKSADMGQKLKRFEPQAGRNQQNVADKKVSEALSKLRAGPGRGLTMSAHQTLSRGSRDSRRVQSGHAGASKPFQTEDGRWVYLDNYSYN